jgi:hypothetical protein
MLGPVSIGRVELFCGALLGGLVLGALLGLG